MYSPFMAMYSKLHSCTLTCNMARCAAIKIHRLNGTHRKQLLPICPCMTDVLQCIILSSHTVGNTSPPPINRKIVFLETGPW